jgi:hypothetical protein
MLYAYYIISSIKNINLIEFIRFTNQELYFMYLFIYLFSCRKLSLSLPLLYLCLEAEIAARILLIIPLMAMTTLASSIFTNVSLISLSRAALSTSRSLAARIVSLLWLQLRKIGALVWINAVTKISIPSNILLWPNAIKSMPKRLINTIIK